MSDPSKNQAWKLSYLLMILLDLCIERMIKYLTTNLILSKVGGIGTNANQKVLAQNWGTADG